MAVGSRVFFDMMHNPPAKAIILGDSCSHVTVPVAESAIGWNIFQVSNLDSIPFDIQIYAVMKEKHSEMPIYKLPALLFNVY
jgi:hypothetical protein